MLSICYTFVVHQFFSIIKSSMGTKLLRSLKQTLASSHKILDEYLDEYVKNDPLYLIVRILVSSSSSCPKTLLFYKKTPPK